MTQLCNICKDTVATRLMLSEDYPDKFRVTFSSGIDVVCQPCHNRVYFFAPVDHLSLDARLIEMLNLALNLTPKGEY